MAAAFLAITCWHPMLGIVILLLFALPAIALFTSRWRTILIAVLPALIMVSFLWAWSFRVSLSVGWRPESIDYQTTIQRGRLFFFRFHYAQSNGDWTPWIDGYPEPKTNHWSVWPGFHQERYWVRAPGVELADSEFISSMTSRSAVENVDVLTTSFWFVLVVYSAAVVAMAWRANRRARSPGAPLEASPTGG